MGDDLEISVQIVDLSGKTVRSEVFTSYNTNETWDVMTWNGTNQYRQDVAPGMYLVKLMARSLITYKVQVLNNKLLYVR